MEINGLKIEKETKGEETVFHLKGEINNLTARSLDAELAAVSGNKLVFECKNLDYITSSGIRVMLVAKKEMSSRGGYFYATDMNDAIKEILDTVGLLNEFSK